MKIDSNTLFIDMKEKKIQKCEFKKKLATLNTDAMYIFAI